MLCNYWCLWLLTADNTELPLSSQDTIHRSVVCGMWSECWHILVRLITPTFSLAFNFCSPVLAITSCPTSMQLLADSPETYTFVCTASGETGTEVSFLAGSEPLVPGGRTSVSTRTLPSGLIQATFVIENAINEDVGKCHSFPCVSVTSCFHTLM